MTLPDERYRAILHTQQFLLELCQPQITARVPLAIRQRARALLKHYPSAYDLDQLSERSPGIVARQIDPLTRAVMTHDQLHQISNPGIDAV